MSERPNPELRQFHFRTQWKIQAEPSRVYHFIAAPEHYSKWMHRVKIRVRVLSPSYDESGVGRKDLFEVRGFFPYTLRWTLECVEAIRPYRIVSNAVGDLEGQGVWMFSAQENGNATAVTFDWNVDLYKKGLRPLATFFPSLLRWNHDWVMKSWEKSLKAAVR